jgi:hypothetical protein
MLQNFFPLYRYIRGIIIAILPILLVLFSISVRLPDAQLHKDTLLNSNFYNSLSTQIKSYEPGYDPKNAFLSLVIASTIDDFASPGWLQNITEKNIDLTTAWLRGDTEDWSFYLPSQDISLAVNDKIDAKTKDFVNQYGSSINTCSDTQANDLKTQGFDTTKDFCLPKSVLDGSQTLSSFFGYDVNSNKNQSVLDSLFKNGFFNGNTDNFSFSSTLGSSQSNIYNWIKTFRDYFVGFRKIILPLFGVLAVIILLLVLLAPRVGKKSLPELRRILTYSGYSTIIISVCVILVLGGAAYIISAVKVALFPGFGTDKISSILTWQMVLFSFNIVSLAIYIGVGFFVASLILWLVDKIGFLRKIKMKNEKLVTKPTNNLNNKTLDGQFQRATVSTDLQTGQEFQNNDIIENYEMPIVGIRPDYKSVTFNYDVLAKNQQTQTPHHQPNIIDNDTQQVTSVTYTAVKPTPTDTTLNNPVDSDYTDNSESTTNTDPNPTSPTNPPTTPPKKNITWF